MPLKVIALNGSPRKDGNTFHALTRVLQVLEDAGIETELVQLRDKKINHCLSCYKCAQNHDKHCIQGDDLNALIDKLLAADGILLGSPVYFGGPSSKLKALIDRAGLVSRVNGGLLTRKVGAPVIAVRRQGAVTTYIEILNFMAINEMVMVGSSYWNMAIGKDPGDVLADEEGMRTLDDLGKHFAWALQKLAN